MVDIRSSETLDIQIVGHIVQTEVEPGVEAHHSLVTQYTCFPVALNVEVLCLCSRMAVRTADGDIAVSRRIDSGRHTPNFARPCHCSNAPVHTGGIELEHAAGADGRRQVAQGRHEVLGCCTPFFVIQRRGLITCSGGCMSCTPRQLSWSFLVLLRQSLIVDHVLYILVVASKE